MVMNTSNEGLKRLSEELDKTGVISEDFKNILIGWAIHAVGQAYRAGQAGGYDKLKEAEDARR
jgi:hypothetical protein